MARILIADDEEGIRTFLGEVLEGEGHEVVLAADGAEAARYLDAQSFHLMLTDLKMPRLDGMALVEKVREEQPELEVIVLTAHGTVDSAVQAMKLGAFDYLQKPLASPSELRILVARALERRGLRDLEALRGDEAGPRLTWGDPAMAPVIGALEKVARTDATVLLVGESGTGKEVSARAIHAWSKRSEGPFVAVNCAAIADQLIESELFGHEKGAFTGATATRRGRIELAEGGTFFLDEVGELKLELQAKLLRVLQERRYERVGGARTFTADVRWIAATNRDLQAEMAAGRFREDLYHRLAVFPVQLPPLRRRPKDILPLARLLLDQVAREMGRAPLSLDDHARAALVEHEWPGNVRELKNVLERAAILAEGDLISPSHLMLRLGEPVGPAASHGETLADLEREAIVRALEAVGGHRQKAADRLGIAVRTLYDKLKLYGLK